MSYHHERLISIASESRRAITNMAHAFTRASNALERIASAMEEANRIEASKDGA